jgi:hypothetical protein
MHDDASCNNAPNDNLSLLCNLELIMGLLTILLLLDCVHSLIKFAQSCDVFVGNFINAMKMCQLELY